MSNNSLVVEPIFKTPISARALAFLQQRPDVADELSAGITGGFAVLGIKGKVWTIKHRGENTQILAVSQPGMPPQPVPHLAVTIIAASDRLTKTWYEAGYKEGSTEMPDCFSMNGEVPDSSSKKKQNQTCATCKWNQFGSRVSPDGASRGKACQDSKRVALVPTDDLKNEINGGAMMLRVPPASLSSLQEYAGKLKAMQAVFFAVSTWIYFDPNEAYPKILFAGHRPLNDDEFEFILNLRENDPVVKRIIDSTEAVTAPTVSDDPAQGAVPQPTLQSVVQPAPQPAPAPVIAPVPEATQASTVPPAPVETPEEKEMREFREFQAAKAAAQGAAAAPPPANQNPNPIPPSAPPSVVQTAPPVTQAAPTRAPAPSPASSAAPNPTAAGAPSGAPQGAGAFTSFLNDLTG